LEISIHVLAYICVFTRDSIYAVARICHRLSVRLSVCPSVTRVDQSKRLKFLQGKFHPEILKGSP